MIHSCEIENFRCFKRIEVSGLKRFTFLVGDSGTGKTAFLESLFLSGGSNAEIYFRVRRWRGLGESAIELSGTRASFESIFRDLFHNFDQKDGASITITDAERGYRTLEIFFEKKEKYELPLKGAPKPENIFLLVPLTFKWTTPQKIMYSTIEIKNGQLNLEGSPDVYPIIFVSPKTTFAKFDAQRYSDLSRENRAEPVLKAIHRIFPEIRNITMESIAGEPVLHGYIEGLREKIPLVDLSSGLNKYLSLVLSILVNTHGTVLVDEIENSFYHENLAVILDSIFDLCDEHQVQLIASTHSYEFLEALAKAMSLRGTDGKGFSCLRFERLGGLKSILQQPSITVIEGASVKAAIENGFEVR